MPTDLPPDYKPQPKSDPNSPVDPTVPGSAPAFPPTQGEDSRDKPQGVEALQAKADDHQVEIVFCGAQKRFLRFRHDLERVQLALELSQELGQLLVVFLQQQRCFTQKLDVVNLSKRHVLLDVSQIYKFITH